MFTVTTTEPSQYCRSCVNIFPFSYFILLNMAITLTHSLLLTNLPLVKKGQINVRSLQYYDQNKGLRCYSTVIIVDFLPFSYYC